MTIRPPAVAGSFYPGDGAAIDAEIGRLMPLRHAAPARAVVVPHAGWMYSGTVAGETYAQVAVPRLAVLLGPNHTGLGAPAALVREGAWRYPGATVPVSRPLAEALLGATDASLDFARSLGFSRVWTRSTLPEVPFDAIVDATNAVELPAFAIDRVEPGGRVVYIGLSGEPSLIDTRRAVLKDLTVVGVLSASGGLAETIEAYASGAVDPRLAALTNRLVGNPVDAAVIETCGGLVLRFGGAALIASSSEKCEEQKRSTCCRP